MFNWAGSPSGWINENMWEAWVLVVFIPWIQQRCKELGLPVDTNALLWPDGHTTRANESAIQAMEKPHIVLATIGVVNLISNKKFNSEHTIHHMLQKVVIPLFACEHFQLKARKMSIWNFLFLFSLFSFLFCFLFFRPFFFPLFFFFFFRFFFPVVHFWFLGTWLRSLHLKVSCQTLDTLEKMFFVVSQPHPLSLSKDLQGFGVGTKGTKRMFAKLTWWYPHKMPRGVPDVQRPSMPFSFLQDRLQGGLWVCNVRGPFWMRHSPHNPKAGECGMSCWGSQHRWCHDSKKPGKHQGLRGMCSHQATAALEYCREHLVVSFFGWQTGWIFCWPTKQKALAWSNRMLIHPNETVQPSRPRYLMMCGWCPKSRWAKGPSRPRTRNAQGWREREGLGCRFVGVFLLPSERKLLFVCSTHSTRFRPCWIQSEDLWTCILFEEKKDELANTQKQTSKPTPTYFFPGSTLLSI